MMQQKYNEMILPERKNIYRIKFLNKKF